MILQHALDTERATGVAPGELVGTGTDEPVPATVDHDEDLDD